MKPSFLTMAGIKIYQNIWWLSISINNVKFSTSKLFCFQRTLAPQDASADVSDAGYVRNVRGTELFAKARATHLLEADTRTLGRIRYSSRKFSYPRHLIPFRSFIFSYVGCKCDFVKRITETVVFVKIIQSRKFFQYFWER